MSRGADTEARIDAYVAAVLADAPPVSVDLAERVWRLLDAVKPPQVMSARAKRTSIAKKRADEARAEARRMERGRSACGICDVPKVGHYYNDSHHTWEMKK